jgi:RyR domain
MSENLTYDPAEIARVCHEANRALQHVNGEPDPSPAWDDAPEWQRESAAEGVEKAQAGATPEQLHESWCQFKLADGWRHGETKDAGAKTHPCLVPYAELPEGQRRKDALFHAIVEAMSS